MTKKILIVDDEASLTRMVKANLERTGRFTVLTENDPMVALEAAKAFGPDLMFLDVMMPGKEGSELAAEMRNEPQLADIPIVFMTAIVTKNETGPGVSDIGGNLFLAKPVKTAELLETIDKLLGT